MNRLFMVSYRAYLRYDVFWQTYYPPNGWGCNCRVRQIGRAEYGRLRSGGKIQIAAPKLGTKKVPDPRIPRRKGVKHPQITVPVGVDAGWAYNAGAAPWRGLADGALRKTRDLQNKVGEPQARRFVGKLVEGAAFGKFYRTPGLLGNDSAYPLAITNDKKVLTVSARAVAHIKAGHKDITPTRLAQVQAAILDADSQQAREVIDGEVREKVASPAHQLAIIYAVAGGRREVVSVWSLPSKAAQQKATIKQFLSASDKK